MHVNSVSGAPRVVSALLVLTVGLFCGYTLFQGTSDSNIPAGGVAVLADGGAPTPPPPWSIPNLDGGAPTPPAPWGVLTADGGAPTPPAPWAISVRA